MQLAFAEASGDFRSGFDLCVLVGRPADDKRVARSLCPTRSLIVATPDCLQRAGVTQR